MIEIVQQQQAGDMPGQLIMNVHDELISEVPEDKYAEYARAAMKVMLSWPTRMVKLKVDCEYGPDLGHLQKFKEVAQ
jgi:DNA polymerase I-like protein with 3'-5' exonuclease and polymerase domains